MTPTILPAGQCGGAGKSRDLHFDDLVFMFRSVIGDEDLCRQLFVARRDEEDFAVKPQLPDDGVARPLRHADDATFGAAARLCGR